MTEYSPDFLLRLYTTMLRIRICEESFIEPIVSNEIRCPVHLYSGEEAIATGVCAALSDNDYIFGTHRSHGHYIAKGGDLNKLVAEIYGKETGCSRGRGGSMHVIDPEKGIVGAVPIVAGTISLATGAALAIKIRKEKRVSVCFFGDGAAGEGVLYESINLAALQNLPVIFVCENNLYSTHMPILECRPNGDICESGKPFDVTSFQIDGNNILETFKTAETAVKLCKSKQGPVFMECLTYRLRGHVGPDDNIQGTHTDIRPLEEIQEWKKKDPIVNFEKFLLQNHIVTEAGIKEINSKIHQEIDEAHLRAKKSAYPPKGELINYVFKS